MMNISMFFLKNNVFFLWILWFGGSFWPRGQVICKEPAAPEKLLSLWNDVGLASSFGSFAYGVVWGALKQSVRKQSSQRSWIVGFVVVFQWILCFVLGLRCRSDPLPHPSFGGRSPFFYEFVARAVFAQF